MHPRRVGKVSISLFVVLTVILIGIVVRDVAIRAFLLVPIILILPGYALTTAVFSEQALDSSARLTMSLGLGFTITVLGGILFFWLRTSFGASSWAVLLGELMLISIIIALVRRGGRYQSSVSDVQRVFGVGEILFFGLATLTLVGAIRLSRTGADQQSFTDFTQLWILPTAQEGRKAVQIGIFNGEAEKMSYKLLLNVENQIVAKWEPIILEPGESWETTNVLPIDSKAQTAGAQLFHLDDPNTSYRHVRIWFDR